MEKNLSKNVSITTPYFQQDFNVHCTEMVLRLLQYSLISLKKNIVSIRQDYSSEVRF